MWHFILSSALIGALQTGDLVFVRLDCGDTCEAIEKVTQEQFSYTEKSFSHLGLIELVQDQVYVIDAWPAGGVRKLPLQEFLDSTGAIRQSAVWGRVRSPYRNQSKKAVEAAKSFLGTEYDPLFELGTQQLYCSELVLFAWDDVFRISPMSFGAKGSREREIWEDYFQKREASLPEGRPGISPLGIYLQAKEASIIESLPFP